MFEAFHWQDLPCTAPGRIVLTQQTLGIPGLRAFGWHDMKNAYPALKDHYHENAFELTFVTKGSLRFSTGDTAYTVAGGDVFLTQPSEVHSTNEAPMSVGEICWMQLDASVLEGFLFLSRESAQALVSQMAQATDHCIRTDNQTVPRLLKDLKAALLNQSPSYHRFHAASCLVLLLYELLSFTGAEHRRLTPDIAKACQFVADHLKEELTLDQLAAVSCLSTSQFKYKFKSQMGISPRNYINQQKIEAIKQMLTPQCCLTEVASDFGFCNSSYFSVVFKKYTGMSPSSFLQSLCQ